MTSITSPRDIVEMFADLKRQHFYGHVAFEFRNGELCMIRTESTQIVKATTMENPSNEHRTSR